jgi:hypothetical protein
VIARWPRTIWLIREAGSRSAIASGVGGEASRFQLVFQYLAGVRRGSGQRPRSGDCHLRSSSMIIRDLHVPGVSVANFSGEWLYPLPTALAQRQ